MKSIFYTVNIKYNSIRLQTELLEKILSRSYETNSIFVHSINEAFEYSLNKENVIFITYGQYIPGLLFKRSFKNIVLIFHNITPPKYFIKSDPFVAILSLLGYFQLFLLSFRKVNWVAVSDYNKKILEKMGHKNVLLCPNIVEKIDFPFIKKFTKPTLLYVGRIVENKDCLSLLKNVYSSAIMYKDEIDFYIVGKGKRGSKYLKKFERILYYKPANLNIHWLQGISYSELVNLYQKSWLYITMSKHEGFGLPVCESLTYGTPAIYTSCGGQESIMNNIGLCKEQEMSKVIYSFLQNNELLEELFNKELNIVKQYQEPEICKTIEKIYGRFFTKSFKKTF